MKPLSNVPAIWFPAHLRWQRWQPLRPRHPPPLSVDDALHAAIRLLDLFRDGLGPSDRKSLALLARRLTRIRSLAEKLLFPERAEK